MIRCLFLPTYGAALSSEADMMTIVMLFGDVLEMRYDEATTRVIESRSYED